LVVHGLDWLRLNFVWLFGLWLEVRLCVELGVGLDVGVVVWLVVGLRVCLHELGVDVDLGVGFVF
jgi:hypothetical protein